MLTRLKPDRDHLLLWVDLAGTFVFAVEGALAAADARLDLFGVMVLAFATALGGGIVRDLLIGAVPPNSIHDRRYPIAAFAGATMVILLHPFVQQVPVVVLVVLDALGLGLFAVAGTLKALHYKIDPFMAPFLGTITGVGGGTIRDLFLAQVPTVLQKDIYAMAALIGAAVMTIGIQRGGSRIWMAALGGGLCVLIRLVSYWQHWNLPTVR